MSKKIPRNEKPKNFKQSMKRLLNDLNTYKVLIIVSLLLACTGSILSLVSPNKLRDLTDKISTGLVIKKDNLETINKKITNNMDFSNKINTILTSNVSDSDKLKFQNILSNLDINDKTKLISSINKIPTSIKKLIFTDFKVDDVTINYKDQIKYLNIMSNIENMEDVTSIYSSIEKLPKNIYNVVKPVMDMDGIKYLSIFLLIVYLVSALFNYIEGISMVTVSNKFANLLRKKISLKINKIPLKFFDKTETGDVLSVVTNDIDTISQSLNQSLSSLVSGITLLVGSIIMMFVTNWILALTAILSSLFGFIFMGIILGKSQKYFNLRQIELGKLNGHIEEVYSGLNIIKTYNTKNIVEKEFDNLNDRVYVCNKKSQFLSGLMMPFMNFIGNFGYVAVCIVGSLLVINNHITFGVIVAFIVYVRMFTSPLSQIAQAFTFLQSVTAASERVYKLLDEKEMTKEDKLKIYLNKNNIKGNVKFKHVKFGYDKKLIIKDFNANIKSGSKVAIVGPTGAGKTTMVNLLMKFYDINSGDILIDNVPISTLKRDNVHELFTMVLQDTWLFDGTIYDNIVYNRKDVSLDYVKKVCKDVGVDHYIKTLPNGYDSIISDTDSISAGQKQLLTIARGMINTTPFLILDEATSNVDTRTEELVAKAMDKLIEGRTSFIIAHRLSTIKNADLILVMDNGNIIEQGNHEELMTKKGFYYDLYNSQFVKNNS